MFLSTLRRFDEGIAEVKYAEALDPASPIHPSVLGNLLLEAGRFDEAIIALKRALELDPNLVNTHLYLAWLYGLTGKGDLAIAESRRAIELGYPFSRYSLRAMPRQEKKPKLRYT